MQLKKFVWAITVLFMAGALTSCNLGKAPEPTADVNAIYTSAAQTMIAALNVQQTQTAEAVTPTSQASATAPASLTPLATIPISTGSVPFGKLGCPRCQGHSRFGSNRGESGSSEVQDRLRRLRKILSEYHHVLLVKFKSPAKAEPDVICSIYRYWLDPDAPAEKKEQADTFWKEYFGESKNILLTMLELEKIAFNAGYTLALALVNGSCRLCETCNIKNGICTHPSMARIPEHAVGVNMKKTAGKGRHGAPVPSLGKSHTDGDAAHRLTGL